MRTGTPKVSAAATWLVAVAAGLPLSAQTAPADGGPAGSDADLVVWTAAALETLLARRDYPSFLLISTLGRTTSLDDASSLDLDRLVRAVSPPSLDALGDDAEGDDPEAVADRELDACRLERGVTEGTLCSMERLAALAPRGLAGDLTEEGARLVALSSDGPAAMALDPLQTFGESALEGAWRRARAPGDGPGPELLDGALTRLVGISTRASSGDVLDHAPRLKNLLESYPVLGAMDPAIGSTVSAGDAYQTFLSGVVAGLGPSGGRAYAAMSGSEPLPVGSIDPSTHVRAPDVEWATGKSFVYLAARSAQLAGAGPDTAERMRTLGGAAVDLRREMGTLPSSLATVGRDLAVATLSGNVLALASRVTSFFRGAPGALGPDAAREVRALREGLEGMRSELRLGMGSMDRRLDDLLDGVDGRFSRLEGLVETTGGDVRADLSALHDDVAALGERLQWMDASVRSYVRAGFDREHARTLVTCLEHRERYLPPWNQMTFEVFSECLAYFRARAVADARDALLVDHSTDLDDLSLIAALADRSLTNLAHRLPLLARVAAERFAYPGMGEETRLANLVEWAVASEAYVTLLRDWPDHAAAVSTGDLEAMRAVGRDLQLALRAISTHDAMGEPAPLLGRVTGYYRERLDELGREADSLAHRHRQRRLLRVPPETLLARLEGHDGSWPPLHVPAIIAAAVPTAPKTSAVLGLEDVELRYTLESEDSVSRANFRRRFLFFGRRHDRFTHTRVTVDVTLHVGSLGTIARFRATSPFFLLRVEEMNGDEHSDRVVSSAVHVEDPHAHFLAVEWPLLSEDPGAWEVEPVEPRVLDALEMRIDAELRRHSTVGLNSVFAAVCADDARSVRLSGTDRSSAVVVRNALNGLSAARALLEGYLRLAVALSDEGASDSVLSGAAELLDRRSLCAGMEQGENPLRMVWLEEDDGRRLEEIRDRLAEVLSTTANGGETPTLVDSTLDRLDAALRVQRLRAAVATTR